MHGSYKASGFLIPDAQVLLLKHHQHNEQASIMSMLHEDYKELYDNRRPEAKW